MPGPPLSGGPGAVDLLGSLSVGGDIALVRRGLRLARLHAVATLLFALMVWVGIHDGIADFEPGRAVRDLLSGHPLRFLLGAWNELLGRFLLAKIGVVGLLVTFWLGVASSFYCRPRRLPIATTIAHPPLLLLVVTTAVTLGVHDLIDGLQERFDAIVAAVKFILGHI